MLKIDAGTRAFLVAQLVAVHPLLTTVEDYEDASVVSNIVADNLMTQLAVAFPGCSFQAVPSAGGIPEVRLEWADGPTRADVEGFCARYETTEVKETGDRVTKPNTPWMTAFGAVRKVTQMRHFSTRAIHEGIRSLETRYGGPFVELAKSSAMWQDRTLTMQTVHVPGKGVYMARTLLMVELSRMRWSRTSAIPG